MAKLKNEMQKIHRKKVRKAKERLKEFEKGKASYEKLDSAARKVFYKRLKAGYEFPARLRSSGESAGTSTPK
jgi:Xaa-Pro aminopeptidase